MEDNMHRNFTICSVLVTFITIAVLGQNAWAQKIAPNPLKINELYYTGSFAAGLLSANDTYVELYNSSKTEAVYLDGMVIARFGTSAADSNGAITSSQLQAYKFPGNPGGHVYLVSPLSFVVLARNAQDFTSQGGLNLSGADWEFYSGDPFLDKDNPAPNLTPLHASILSQDFTMGTTDDAIALCDGTDTTLSDGIQISTIINAVEYHSSAPTTKILPAVLDSGYAGAFVATGLSIERITAGYDTHNSTVDFDTTKPTPGYEHGTSGGGQLSILPNIYPLKLGGYSLFDEYTVDTNGNRIDSTLHPASKLITDTSLVYGGISACQQNDSTTLKNTAALAQIEYFRNPDGIDVQEYADQTFYQNVLGPLSGILSLPNQWLDMYKGSAGLKISYPILSIDTSVTVSTFPLTIQITSTAEWAGTDSITVPAGTFYCYRFETTVHLQVTLSSIIPVINTTFVQKAWLASNVGIVKLISPSVNLSLPGSGAQSSPGFEDDLRYNGKVVVSVKQIASIAPLSIELEQNYPNPFSDHTSLRFSVPVEQAVSL